MTRSRRYDAVFFDLGQTLVRPEPSFPALFSQVCARHGVGLTESVLTDLLSLIDAEIAAEQARGSGFSHSVDHSRRFWTALYQRVLATRFGSYPEHLPQEIYNCFSDLRNYQLYPDVLPALTALREAGIQLAIISNWEAWAEEMVEVLALRPFFDVTLISGIAGIEKPDPRLFQMAIEGTGVTAARALHVGDNPAHDCEAAHAVGISPILLDRYDRHAASPWARITTLDRFAEQFLYSERS
jgi:putative hydrolase of the HAD superfamily